MTIVADAAATTTAWFTLAGALGGVLLTSAVALVTAVLNHRRQTQTAQRQFRQELDRQLRQERRESYARYLSAWNRLSQQLRTLHDEVVKLGLLQTPRSNWCKRPPPSSSRHDR